MNKINVIFFKYFSFLKNLDIFPQYIALIINRIFYLELFIDFQNEFKKIYLYIYTHTHTYIYIYILLYFYTFSKRAFKDL